MGHYLSEMEDDDPPEIVEARRRRAEERRNRLLSQVTRDLAQRGVAEVITDLLLSPENYRSDLAVRY